MAFSISYSNFLVPKFFIFMCICVSVYVKNANIENIQHILKNMLMYAKSHIEPRSRNVLISHVTSIELSMNWTLLGGTLALEVTLGCHSHFGGTSYSSSILKGSVQLLGPLKC